MFQNALASLFTRARSSRFVRRDVCLRWTLGCHAPIRAAVKKNKKPTPPASCHLDTSTSSTTTAYPHIYSSPASSIFYSKYRPTPTPPRLSPHEQSPASTRSLERHTATFACLDTESHAFSYTYTSSPWPPPPLPQYHKAPSPPLRLTET